MATLPAGPRLSPPGHLYPSPGHSHAPPHWHDTSTGGVRQTGYDFGRSDRFAGLDSRPDRYRNRVSSKHWNTFVAGYRDGYASVHIGGRPPAGHPGHADYNATVYRSGVSLGELDRRRGLSSDYRRYTSRTEASFRAGYLHGWQHGR